MNPTCSDPLQLKHSTNIPETLSETGTNGSSLCIYSYSYQWSPPQTLNLLGLVHVSLANQQCKQGA